MLRSHRGDSGEVLESGENREEGRKERMFEIGKKKLELEICGNMASCWPQVPYTSQ